MTDRYDQDLLLDYLEGDLDPGHRAQVQQMLAADPQLAALMDGLRSDRELLRSLPREPVPDDLNVDLVQGLERRMLLDAPQVGPTGPIPIQRGAGLPRPAPGVRWGRVLGLGSLAAAVLLAAGLVFYMNQANPLSRTAMDLTHPLASPPDTPPSPENPNSPAAAGSTPLGDAWAATAQQNATGLREHAQAPDRPHPEMASLALDHAASPASDAEAAPTRSSPSQARVVTEQTDPAGATIQTPAGPAFVAFASPASQQTLRIETDDPASSQEQLLQWCLTNAVPIVEPHIEAEADDTAAQHPDRNYEYALLIEAKQLDSLVTSLNRPAPAEPLQQSATIDQDSTDGFAQALRSLVEDDNTQARRTPRGEGQTTPAVSLNAPDDLGNTFRTQRNIDNTLALSDNQELARAARRDIEVFDDPQHLTLSDDETPTADTTPPPPPEVTPGVTTSETTLLDEAPPEAAALDTITSQEIVSDTEGVPADGAGPQETTSAGRESRRDTEGHGGEAPQAHGDAAVETDLGHDTTAPEDRAEDEEEPEAASVLEEPQPAPPTPSRNRGRRGNWLLPQLPLAPTTPLGSDPPRAQLVPIVIVLRSRTDDGAAEHGDATADLEESSEVEADPVDAPPEEEQAPPPAPSTESAED